jgi:hypothetical protein
MTLATGVDAFNLCDGVIRAHDMVYAVYNKDWLLGVGVKGLMLTVANRSKLIELDERHRLLIIGVDDL